MSDFDDRPISFEEKLAHFMEQFTSKKQREIAERMNGASDGPPPVQPTHAPAPQPSGPKPPDNLLSQIWSWIAD